VQRGDLSDIDGLVAGARACDGVIHLAFIHDFANYEASIAADLAAVSAMTQALARSGKPFIGTSGTLMGAFGRAATLVETDAPVSEALPRAAAEAAVVGGAGLRGCVVRLAPTVHGAGDQGFVPTFIGVAREKGFAAYVGEGANRWPAVHRLDAARLFRLALEGAKAGTRLHAAAEAGVTMRAIAETIAAGLGVPARSLPAEEAEAHFGWIGRFAMLDNPTSSALTRKALGWTPREPDLLADMRANYFG
jgi:nucleoside-diphosphate-sugar epimerase